MDYELDIPWKTDDLTWCIAEEQLLILSSMNSIHWNPEMNNVWFSSMTHCSVMQTRPSKSTLTSGPKQSRRGLCSLEVAVQGQQSPCQGCQTIGIPFMWVGSLSAHTCVCTCVCLHTADRAGRLLYLYIRHQLADHFSPISLSLIFFHTLTPSPSLPHTLLSLTLTLPPSLTLSSHSDDLLLLEPQAW